MTVPDGTQGQADPNANSNPVVAEEPAGTGTPAPPAQENKPVYWQELETLPQDVRPLVEPIFKEWNTNVDKRFQSVHSEYEPYKSLIDEWEPDALQQAVQIAQMIEQNPQDFVQQLIQAYGIDLGQGAASPTPQGQPNDPDDLLSLPDDPRFAQLEQQQQLLEALAQTVLSERQGKELAQQQAELDSVLTDLKTQYGEFDESYVLSLIANGLDPLDAVANFHQAVGTYANKVNAPNANAPTVLGQGGGYPSQQVDPATLDNKGTEDLIVQMLRAANHQG